MTSPQRETPAMVRDMSYAPLRVVSDFGGALNGWSFARPDAPSKIEHRLEPGADGGRGFLRFHDGRNGAAAYLAMPASHLGDQSALWGGAITFSMRIQSGGRWIGEESPLLRIVGANGETMSHYHPTPPGRGAWSRITVPLAASDWRIGEAPADPARMRAILADIAAVELRIEQTHGGEEIIDLDDVTFVADYGLVRAGR